MIIIGGSASQELATKVAKELDVEFSAPLVKKFPDGELYVQVACEMKDQEVTVIQSTYRPQNDHLIELLFILDVASDHGAKKVTVIIPYLSYARQDKRFKFGEALSAKTVARLIESSGASEVFCIDLHAQHILNFFKIPAYELTAMPLIGDYLKTLNLKNPIVIAPDEGAINLAEIVASRIQAQYDYLEKTRLGPGQVVIKTKKFEVKNRDVILIDDIIDSGGTMAEAMRLLKKQGTHQLIGACTHPVLSGDALSKIYGAGATKVIATDTIPSEISIVTVAPVIAQALRGER